MPDFDSRPMLALFIEGGAIRAGMAGRETAEIWLGMVMRDAGASREELQRARECGPLRKEVRRGLWRAMGFEPEGKAHG
jgi:hypothetical protein